MVSGKANNTYQEALEIKKLIQSSKIPNQITLVTSAFHMSRAIVLFEKQDIVVKPYPVDFKSSNLAFSKIIFNPLNWLPNTNSLNKTNYSLREIYGLIIYKWLKL